MDQAISELTSVITSLVCYHSTMATVNKKTLIVNYLPQSLSDMEFQTMFASVGQVMSSKIVRERATGYSYGFGFVEYATEIDAANAIQALNGVQLQNKVIKVAYSRQGGRIKGANLYVRGLPPACTAIELEQLFVPYGDVVQCRVLTDAHTGISRGVGFVLFSVRDQAEAAVAALNNFTPPGFHGPLVVQFAEDTNKKRDKPGGNAAPGSNPIPPGGVQNMFAGYPFSGYPSGFGNGYGMMAPASNFGGPMRNQMSKQRYNPMAKGGRSSYQAGSGAGGKANNLGHILFAYNIGPNTTESQLWELFSAYGTVLKSDVIRDPATMAGRGYGFVTMPNYEEAQLAIQNLNGYCYSTKPLQVSFKSAKAGAKQ